MVETIPALFTSTSSRPWRSTVVPTRARAASGVVRSPTLPTGVDALGAELRDAVVDPAGGGAEHDGRPHPSEQRGGREADPVGAAGTGDHGDPAVEVERGRPGDLLRAHAGQAIVIAAPAQATAHSTLVKVPMMNRSAAPGVSVRSSG